MHVFNHGIFNTTDYALSTSATQNSNQANSTGVYTVLNGYSGSPLAEMLYVAYDKLNELTGAHLPLTPAERVNFDLGVRARNEHFIIDTANHSRGAITMTIASQRLLEMHKANPQFVVPFGTVLFNGAAANAQREADRIDALSNGQSQMYQANHPSDWVGLGIGFNSTTGGLSASGHFPGSHRSDTGFAQSLGQSACV